MVEMNIKCSVCGRLMTHYRMYDYKCSNHRCEEIKQEQTRQLMREWAKKQEREMDSKKSEGG